MLHESDVNVPGIVTFYEFDTYGISQSLDRVAPDVVQAQPQVSNVRIGQPAGIPEFPSTRIKREAAAVQRSV